VVAFINPSSYIGSHSAISLLVHHALNGQSASYVEQQ